MSLSVSGSHTNNSVAYLQSLWQQASSAGSTQTQSDPLSSLLAELGQQGFGSVSSSNSPASFASGTNTAAASALSQFGPQTLQALLALQTNGSNAQSPASQLGSAANSLDPASLLSSQQSQDQHRHHHHLDASNSGATASNNATNSSSSSEASNSSAGGGASGNNLLEQLLQMQAQLVTPTTQSLVTA